MQLACRELFQKALVEKAKGETGQALKTIAESMAAANPYRYVRIYTGYGKRGTELLEEYRSWMEKTETGYHQNKKKYKYGSVLRMPVSDWLGYIMRKAGREKKNYPDLQEEQQNIYRVEKLTDYRTNGAPVSGKRLQQCRNKQEYEYQAAHCKKPHL